MGGMSGGGGGGSVPWAQIGGSAGTGVTALLGWRANDKAADALTGRQHEANALYRGNYADTQTEYRPHQQAGTSALDALLKTYGLGAGQNGQADYSGFESSPDYLWAQQQGQQGVDRSAASRGKLYSGAQMKASQQFGQGLATQHLNSYRGGLQNLASGGLGATNALSNYRMGYGNQLGQGINNLGDIAAAEYLGVANVNKNYVSQMNDVWGVGSGGGGGQPSGGNGYSQQFNSMNTSQTGYPGGGSYSGPGSSSYQFNPWGK
jgi:hypothetical protein